MPSNMSTRPVNDKFVPSDDERSSDEYLPSKVSARQVRPTTEELNSLIPLPRERTLQAVEYRTYTHFMEYYEYQHEKLSLKGLYEQLNINKHAFVERRDSILVQDCDVSTFAALEDHITEVVYVPRLFKVDNALMGTGSALGFIMMDAVIWLVFDTDIRNFLDAWKARQGKLMTEGDVHPQPVPKPDKHRKAKPTNGKTRAQEETEDAVAALKIEKMRPIDRTKLFRKVGILASDKVKGQVTGSLEHRKWFQLLSSSKISRRNKEDRLYWPNVRFLSAEKCQDRLEELLEKWEQFAKAGYLIDEDEVDSLKQNLDRLDEGEECYSDDSSESG